MFKKHFTVRSNTNIRNSDRRKLFSRLPESVCSSFTSKQLFSVVRVQTSLGVWVNLYMCDKNPIFFEPDTGNRNILYPSVYLTWMCPGSFPVLFINSNVLGILENGADLMLPGVIRLEEVPFPEFAANSPIAIAILENTSATDEIKFRGPVAIGKTLMSSSDMLSSGMRGRGVEVLHLFHDTLWEFGSKIIPPSFPLEALATNQAILETNIQSDGDPENTDAVANENDGDDQKMSEITDDLEKHMQEVNLTEQSENALRSIFFGALRWRTEKSTFQFPIDAGQFYANVILKNLPEGSRIEMKKTRFKKFSVFLREINDECEESGWLVKVVNKKGIDLIQEINFDHPAIQNADPIPCEYNQSPVESSASKVRVAECFSITEAVLPLFRPGGYKKGDAIQGNQLREFLLNYARAHNLEANGKITLDDTLQIMVKYFLSDAFGINDVVQRISAQMTKAYLITAEDGRQKVLRGKMPVIELKVEKRGGNKVVTLINNVTVFGIDTKSMCHKIQTGAATGTTIIESVPNCEGPQILVHGNQVNFIGDQLINFHGVQKKFIKGLELGVKEKKKKK
ncbi:translation initiation factor SUI1 domain-containing protein [Ditylenchus destructor]|uniref:Translation initiation factor SUI1 domain-containing protein n=1 Tax=Ditylenchus destructor TaxID=166010 RepID=A0AAD4R940_9BILA|nr:translation initiation factor SUI1 domain-containing protein [Ditylenchus destructor]